MLGIYAGESRIIPGFLTWCRISSIHTWANGTKDKNSAVWPSSLISSHTGGLANKLSETSNNKKPRSSCHLGHAAIGFPMGFVLWGLCPGCPFKEAIFPGTIRVNQLDQYTPAALRLGCPSSKRGILEQCIGLGGSIRIKQLWLVTRVPWLLVWQINLGFSLTAILLQSRQTIHNSPTKKCDPYERNPHG